jgi:hypothetical protein
MTLTSQRLLKLGCLTVGVVCLAAGYIMVGQWVLLAITVLAWLVAVFAPGWFGIMFITLIGLAAAGVCAGAWPPLMILSATLALAGWDLASWEGFVEAGLHPETLARFEWKHYVYLTFALGSGLLVALLGRQVSIQLPFGILVVLAILVFLGMDRVLRFVKG